MEKNIIVVDEQGNEIGATYPKRAKGLVKKGRARFTDENKICLACPPDKYTEDIKMKNEITKSRILDMVHELQQSLGSMDKTLFYFSGVDDSQNSAVNDNGEIVVLECYPDIALEKMKAIKEAVMAREQTLKNMLDFYISVYNSIDEESEEAESEE